MPRKRKPIKPMKYPVGIEYSYRKNLLWLTHQLRLSLKRHMIPAIPNMVAEAANIHHLPTGSVVRVDAWRDDLYEVFQKIAKDMVDPKKLTFARATKVPLQVNDYNREEWRSLIRSQYGVNPTREDPTTYIPILKDWAHTNAALINDIPNKTMMEIQEQTIDALMSGKTVDDLTNDIYEIMSSRVDVSESRARLIARDQVAKLNGALTRERQTDAGIDSYVWRTVGDERVRETHDAVDGQTFQWGQPPDETDGNEPGEDYQCRCWAEPVLPDSIDVSADLLDESDVELEDA
jgi:SPP1 gp7 family putative phage head morphogenesis protein